MVLGGVKLETGTTVAYKARCPGVWVQAVVGECVPAPCVFSYTLLGLKGRARGAVMVAPHCAVCVAPCL